jgi:hypothetical protein
MAILFVIYQQSVQSSAVHPAAAHLAAAHSSAPQEGIRRGISEQSSQQQRALTANTAILEPVKPSASSSTSGVILGILVLCSAALIASHHQEQIWPSTLQDPQQQLLLMLQGGLIASSAGVALKLLMWGCIAAASFCLSLQLLPGCFSLGEAALLAHGSTCLLATTAGALPRAMQFVPAAVCVQLPAGLLLSAQRMGSCTAEAHRAALSLKGLTAAITLVLAAAVAACLLLRVVLTALQQLKQLPLSSSRGSSSIRGAKHHANGANKAVSASGAPAAATNSAPNGTCRHTSTVGSSSSSSTTSRGSTRSSWSREPVAIVATLVSALAAAAGICVLLLWLCCAAAWTLLEFLPAVPGRLGVLLYWVGLLAATLPALKWLARVSGMPQVGEAAERL